MRAISEFISSIFVFLLIVAMIGSGSINLNGMVVTTFRVIGFMFGAIERVSEKPQDSTPFVPAPPEQEGRS